MYDTLEEALWSRVEKSDDCWLWTKARCKGGYGSFSYNSKMYKPHRVAWELTNGPIPRGLYVCHKCDVRHCSRPSHLFLGTADDNMKDMARKGRRKNIPSAKAKLTPRQMQLARWMRECGYSPVNIGAVFGVGRCAVWRATVGITKIGRVS